MWLRWRPNIAPLGAPTTLIKDDEYEGYKFPAGTVFTWNAWAISLSDKEYDEPLQFKPERFMNKDLDNALKGHWAFGPGIPPRPFTVQNLICRSKSLCWMECRTTEYVYCHGSTSLLF